ncbi:MAG: hypothetical protein B7X06_00150 [Verrucomicrobia bacterium 21-51-4]|nr:MAG: hypothetical protein B7X06_00150 [Verrucomicrobia bacterium 21-51-4]HQU08516.1 alpha/beta hydrolase [Opitutales bacterium]
MHRNSLYHSIILAIGGLCLAYAGLLIFAYLFASKVIFPAPHASYKDGPEIIWLKLPDGSPVAARYWPCEGATYTVIYSHGNGEDLGMVANRLADCASHGYNLLSYDYPGYGLSEGPASEQRSYEAIRAVYNYARTQLEVPPEQIVIYGYSVGGGPAVELATEVPAHALIIESTFTSSFRVMTQIKIIPWDMFDNLSKIQKIKCPVLIIHGTQDQIVPFWHAKALFKAAHEPKAYLWIKGAGHFNTLQMGGEPYWQALKEFLDYTPNQPSHESQNSPHHSS